MFAESLTQDETWNKELDEERERQTWELLENDYWFFLDDETAKPESIFFGGKLLCLVKRLIRYITHTEYYRVKVE